MENMKNYIKIYTILKKNIYIYIIRQLKKL